MLSWSKSPSSSLLRKRGWGWGPTPWGKSGGWVGSVRIWPAFSTQKGNMPTFRWDPGPALFPQQDLPLIISCRGHPCLHLGCDWPLCQSLWTRVSRISLPPYRFLAMISRQIAAHLSLAPSHRAKSSSFREVISNQVMHTLSGEYIYLISGNTFSRKYLKQGFLCRHSSQMIFLKIV